MKTTREERQVMKKRRMYFYEIGDGQLLLCKEGDGPVGHEVGIINKSVESYLRGYGTSATSFVTKVQPISALGEGPKLSIAWPINDQAFMYATFTPRTLRLTVETLTKPEGEYVNPFAEATQPPRGDEPLAKIGVDSEELISAFGNASLSADKKGMPQ